MRCSFVVALDKTYSFKIPNPEVARQVLQSVSAIAQALSHHLDPSKAP